MKTYGTMRDYIYSKTFQNISSELFNGAVVASKINTAKYICLSKISHPLLTGEYVCELGTSGGTPILGTSFTFDKIFKKIYNVTGLKDGDTNLKSGTVLKRTYKLTDNTGDEYKAYDNSIITTKEYNKIVVFGEVYTKDIQDDNDDWSDRFELGELLASAIEEYVVGFLLPFQLQEGYNQAQFHQQVANDLLKAAAAMYEQADGQNKVKNTIY